MRILEDLGDELERATRAAEESRGGGAARSARQLAAIVVAALLAATGVALAAKAVIERGDPLPAPAVADVPPELTPRPGTTTLDELDVQDPDDGPRWDVRTARSQSGAVCASVGQVLDGELGIVGLDGRFRALPAGAADTCSVAQRDGFTLAGARGLRGARGSAGITVVSGVAGSGVRAVHVTGRDAAPRRLRLGRDRAFLALFAGQPETVLPRLVATLANGRKRAVRFADTGETLVADSSGGTPWALKTPRGRRRGLRCVTARRLRGPDSPPPTAQPIPITPEIPIRCGPRGRAFVATKRFVPRAPRVGGYQFFWGAHPSRTIVWGAAGRARQVRVNGARASVTVDRDTGAFMAVLDGKVDPRRVSVTIRGRTLRGTTALGRRGQRLTPLAIPRWRSVATALRGISRGFVPQRGTLRESARAKDPAGGPDWEMQTVRARIPAGVQVSPGMGRDMQCFLVGQVGDDGRLREPLPGGRTRVLSAAERDMRCNDTTWLQKTASGVQGQVYVDDPYAPAPKPVRVVVAGLLGDHVRSAELLLGAGAPRALPLGRYGSFLLVLEPRYAGTALRVRQVRRDGTAATSASYSAEETCRPDPDPARVADPDGGPSWISGLGRGLLRDRGPRSTPRRALCRFVGQLVDGRVATLLGDTLQLYYSPTWAAIGGASAEFLSRRHPLILEVNGPGDGSNRPPGPLSSAQVARRTLPGRTVVSGIAHRDVVAITLRTPRDIRTIRPQRGSGVYLAVYDGPFYGGEVVATVRMRSGKTVTRRRPLGLH